ncbi:outer membrane protein assembly factor BamB [Orbaceae bacterium ESL0721]|nr:outer membrane protein assembly factor BamB [Orbaceae bacterium ESL0721]
MKLLKYLFSALFMFSLAGCSLFGGEKEIVQVAPAPKVENQFSLQKIWSNSTSGNSDIYSLLGPISYENVVYAAGRSGQVKAMELSTGNTLWNIDLSKSTLFHTQSGLLSGGVSVDDKYVYVASERAIVYAIDRLNGNLVWEKTVKGEVLAKPVPTEDKVIIRTSNGYLQGLNRDTGDALWDASLGVPSLSIRGNSTPTVAHGAAIFGDDNGRVNAFYVKDGQLIWQQRISQPSGSTEIAKLNDIDNTPVVEGNLVYAIGYNGNLTALDLSNGQVVWRKELGSTHSFAVTDDKLFIVDQDDNLLSVSKKGGATLWKREELLHRQLTDPVIYQNYIVVGDFEGYLYWFDMETGDVAAKIDVSGSGFISKPIVIGNTLIVQAKNGNIYAYTKS